MLDTVTKPSFFLLNRNETKAWGLHQVTPPYSISWNEKLTMNWMVFTGFCTQFCTIFAEYLVVISVRDWFKLVLIYILNVFNARDME